jgi:hypothetical protein
MSTFGAPGYGAPGPSHDPADPWTNESETIRVPPARVPAPPVWSGSATPGRPLRQDFENHDEYEYGYVEPLPRTRSRAVPILIVLVIVVVLAVAGVGGYLFLHRNTAAYQQIPVAGNCVSSNGEPEPHTALVVVDCADADFTVLKVFTGTAATSKCRSVPHSNRSFAFAATKNPANSYVVCLKTI